MLLQLPPPNHSGKPFQEPLPLIVDFASIGSDPLHSQKVEAIAGALDMDPLPDMVLRAPWSVETPFAAIVQLEDKPARTSQ